jgi:hypothetical protein
MEIDKTNILIVSISPVAELFNFDRSTISRIKGTAERLRVES